MTPPKTPVTIAVCTFERQKDLACLLESLLALEISHRIDASVIVVDNDGARSAEPVVSAFAARCPWLVRYVSEPEPGIPIARNRRSPRPGGKAFSPSWMTMKRWLLTGLASFLTWRRKPVPPSCRGRL